RNRRRDDPDDDDGFPRQSWPCPHEEVRRPGGQLQQAGGLLEVTARSKANGLWVVEGRTNEERTGSFLARTFRRISVAVSHFPFAILTAVHLRDTQDVSPALPIDRCLCPFVARGEGHVPDHLCRNDLVDVRRALRERLGEHMEELSHLFLADCRTPRAKHRHRLS